MYHKVNFKQKEIYITKRDIYKPDGCNIFVLDGIAILYFYIREIEVKKHSNELKSKLNQMDGFTSLSSLSVW